MSLSARVGSGDETNLKVIQEVRGDSRRDSPWIPHGIPHGIPHIENICSLWLYATALLICQACGTGCGHASISSLISGLISGCSIQCTGFQPCRTPRLQNRAELYTFVQRGRYSVITILIIATNKVKRSNLKRTGMQILVPAAHESYAGSPEQSL